MLTNKFKNRIKFLSGIINENTTGKNFKIENIKNDDIDEVLSLCAKIFG
jgi:hypothetical protein